MNAMDILYGLNNVRDGYVVAVEEFRQGEQQVQRLPKKKLWLIAAVVALALLLVGCAVAYASGWLQRVFTTRSEASLSAEQIDYIESNEQPVGQTQGNQDWSIELKSTISDRTAAYLVFQVTAPEKIDLEQYLNPPTFDAEHLMPGNYSVGKNAAYSMAIASIGNVDRERNYMYVDGGDWMTDNDGKANTVLYCMTIRCNKLYSDRPQTLENPFGKDISFRIRFMGVYLDYTNTAVAESIDAQHAGEEAYIADGEEAAGLFRTDVLTDEEWDFEVTLDADGQFMELITRPITVQARVYYYADAEKSSAYEKREPIDIRSFRVTPFGASVTFDLTPDMNGASLEPDTDNQVCAVMKDGSSIVLQWDGDKLLAQTPIVLSQLDYVLLADGTRLEPADEVDSFFRTPQE